MKKEKKFLWKENILHHLILYSILIAIAMGMVRLIVEGEFHLSMEFLVLSCAMGIFLGYPFVLTILNFFFLFQKTEHSRIRKKGRQIEYITIILGFLYSVLSSIYYQGDIRFGKDFTEVLVNSEVHTPIWTQGYLTIFILACIGIMGYLILVFIPIKKMPPLVCVCAIAAMYIGILLCMVWITQAFGRRFLLLCLCPFNCILIAVKRIRYKVIEWKTEKHPEGIVYQNKYMNLLNQKLMNAERWPVAAFLIMWPLLGIIICILMLFGQQPDSIIKAFTETSDWNLSKRIAPPNVRRDEHYLCTVAAGGHKKVVKPIRMGVRHGHEVIVNRQLCIANAFEQVLEERIPIFHRHVRKCYDTYGFPVAQMIRSPFAADSIYILMKPLECFFLIVLYFYDINPENRIAVQYLPPISKKK